MAMNRWDELQARNAQAIGAQTPSVPKANPSDITKSYYTTPSTADNYESNRPVYEQSQAVKDAANQLSQYEQNKPGPYQSSYGDSIQNMIDKILNREKFQYDFAADPLYQQYADQYQRRGQLAMKDTMAQSAALTGGYGNSYAQQVGQQTYQRYLEDLNGIIPELRDAAYKMYQDEGDTMRQNLGMLQGADEIDYGRYRDTVNDYHTELNYFYNKFNDMSNQEYNIYLNDAAAWEADRAYWYQKAKDDQAQQNWQAEFNENVRQYNESLAASKRGSSGRKNSSKKDTAAEVVYPTSYKEFCAMGGPAGIMTEGEFRRTGGKQGSYQDYLKRMWVKYN